MGLPEPGNSKKGGNKPGVTNAERVQDWTGGFAYGDNSPKPAVILSGDAQEFKTKRYQFNMTPSLWAKLERAKAIQNKSVNEIITTLIETKNSIDELI